MESRLKLKTTPTFGLSNLAAISHNCFFSFGILKAELLLFEGEEAIPSGSSVDTVSKDSTWKKQLPSAPTHTPSPSPVIPFRSVFVNRGIRIRVVQELNRCAFCCN